MFLRNYDNIMLVNCIRPKISSSSSNYIASSNATYFADGYYNIKSTSAAISNITAAIYCNEVNPAFSMSTEGICLGDGNESVTYDDYKLSGNLVTNKLVQVTRTVKYDSETGKWKVTLIASYSNTGSTDITISEWGMWKYNYGTSQTTSSPSYSNSSSSCYLVFREVLDEPIVIEAGTTATLTFSIDIPMPNHP